MLDTLLSVRIPFVYTHLMLCGNKKNYEKVQLCFFFPLLGSKLLAQQILCTCAATETFWGKKKLYKNVSTIIFKNLSGKIKYMIKQQNDETKHNSVCN